MAGRHVAAVLLAAAAWPAAAKSGRGGGSPHGGDCCLHDSVFGKACFQLATAEGAECRALLEKLKASELTDLVTGRNEVGEYGWEKVAFDWIVVPLCLLVVVSLLWLCLSFVYDKIVSVSETNQTWIAMYVGNYNRTPQRPRFVAVLEFIQTVLSLLVAILFVENTVALRESDEMRLFHQCSSVFLTFHFVFRGLQNEFRPSSCFGIEALVDIFTVPGLVYSRHSWLSLSYLRTVSALRAYVRLERLVNLHLSIGPIPHGLLHMFLELMCLVMCFACAIFTLEVLGELPGVAQQPLMTGMGEITVFRMIYWSIETLTTVGYGDYAPSTFLSRLLTMICMLGGLVFFAGQVSKMQDIMASVKSGFSDFVPGTKQKQHLVLVGGISRHFDTNLIGGFMNELYHPTNQREWPDLVIMGSEHSDLVQFRSDVEDHFRNVDPIDSPLNRIHYIIGSPLIKKDLERCHADKASMVYIVSNTSVTDKAGAEEEDKQTTLCTLSFKQHFPQVNYRVALLEGKSVERAYGADIQPNRVFSINTFRGALLCECARCPGWSTMVEHFLSTCAPVLERIPKDAWQYKYLQGRSTGIHGFLAADEFCGRPTNHLVREAYERGGVCIVARSRPVEDGGTGIELMPASADENVTKLCVFWAMCSTSETQLKDIKDWQTDWEQVFTRQRKVAFEKNAKQNKAALHLELEKKYAGISRGDETNGSKGLDDLPKHTKSQMNHEFCSSLESQMEIRRDDIIQAKKDSGTDFALLLDFSETWAEVLVFLNKCRESHLPVKMPVIVLSKTVVSDSETELIEFVQEHEDVAIFHGNPEVEKDLINCGAVQCCSIICVGNESKNEDSFADTDILLVYGLLHRLLLVDKTILLEFQDPEHLCLLPSGYPVERVSEDDVGEEQSVARAEEIIDADCTYTFDPHFVSGEVFLPRFLGTLMGGVARIKGLIELMQRLSMPCLPFDTPTGNKPASAVWQIRVPPALRGQQYGKVFRDLISEEPPAVALGLRKRIGGPAGDPRSPGRRGDDVEAQAPLMDAGANQPQKGGWAVLTNPSADTVVLEDDIIFILASTVGAKKWMHDGLLLNFGHTATPGKATGSERTPSHSSPTLQPRNGR